MKNLRKKLNITLTALLVAAILILGSTGCFGISCSIDGNPRFGFKEVEKTLYVGENKTYTADDFSFESGNVRNFVFKLTSSDDKVLSVADDKTVTAKAEGSVTLTATDLKGRTAECTINVASEIKSFKLMARSRTRTISESREITVYAVVNDGKSAANYYDVKWTIGGEEKEYNGSAYTLPPQSAAGLTKVSASVAAKDGTEFTDELTVGWVSDTAPSAEVSLVSGATEQAYGAVSAVNYAVTGVTHGADAIVVWYVDGEEAGEGNSFGYVPKSVGKHPITAAVNGKTVEAENYVTVTGAVAPTGLTVDFDTFYPKTRVYWSEGSENETFELEITNADSGEIRTYELTGNEKLCGSDELDLANHNYSLRVRSKGDGEARVESPYTSAVKANKLTDEVRTYLSKTWHGGNYYITSDDEFYAIYDYFMLYRAQPTQRETSATYALYMGYSSAYTPSRLSQIAFNRASYTGSYDISATQKGNICTLEFTFYTVSEPSNKHVVSGSSTLALNGINPHVSATGRASDHVFPLDEAEKTAEVSTTDQLYRAAELGYAPVTSGRATTYYAYAKKLLNTILDDGMTDLEKVHAIYDWIMWRVLYDDSASEINEVADAVKCAAFYIEGVLTDTDYLAVCDGMSKTFSLLCNMEGIPAVRVIGKAYSAGNYGGHAWNKVKIDGEWFVCDCTWGDVRVGVTYRESRFSTVTASRSYESASHLYFMLTDSEIAGTHVEDADTAYPATTPLPYDWYAESAQSALNPALKGLVHSGTNLNVYAESVALIANAELANGKRTFTTQGGTTTSSYFDFEIKIAPSDASAIAPILTSADATKNPIAAALTAKGLYYNIVSRDGYIFVIASKSVRLAA